MTSHGEGLSSSSAPILSLGFDIWATISAYLSPNDTLRLQGTGHKALVAHLLGGVSHVSLQWNSHRYLQLDSVFATIKPFKSAREVHFTTRITSLLLFTPINWSSLPGRLTSIKLSFMNAPCFFLSQADLSSLFPQLERLDLHDNEDPVDLYRPSRRFLEFHRLPASLVSLRLLSVSPHKIMPEQFAFLPPHLEEFCLDVPCIRKSPDEPYMMLPSLPDSITSLKVTTDTAELAEPWYVECAKLPLSLKTLVYNCTRPYSGTITALNLKHASRLKYLETLEAPLYTLTMSQAIRLVKDCPRTLTRLNFYLDGHDAPVDEFISLVAGKLCRYDIGGSNSMDAAMMNSSWSATPLLESLYLPAMHHNDPSNPLSLPDSLTSLTMKSGTIVPNSRLRHLKVDNSPLAIFASPPSPFLLTTIHFVDQIMETRHIEALPSSLTSLVARLNRYVWKTLMDSMVDGPDSPARLPHLSVLGASSVPMPLEVISIVPRQLKKLKLTLAVPPTAHPDNLACLQSSHLEDLEISFSPSMMTKKQAPPTIQVLNALPQTLTRLKFSTECSISRHWPVNLPQSLSALHVAHINSPNPEVLDEEDPDAPTAFILPESLTQLVWVHEHPSLSNDMLPPFLSSSMIHICYKTKKLPKYFDSRPIPSNLENGHLHRSY